MIIGDEEDDGHGDETTKHGFGEDFFGIRFFQYPFRVYPREDGREEGSDDGRGGSIASSIVINGFLSDQLYGVTVSKIESGAIVYDLYEGINIAKITSGAVTGLPSSLSLSKAVAYAVIAPNEEVQNSQYQAILFF